MTPMPNAFMTLDDGSNLSRPIESPSNKGGHQEAPAVTVPSAAAAGLLVKYAARRREKAEEHRFVLDEAWFMAMLDDPPEFLREGWR